MSTGEGRLGDVAAAVLVGGASQRMGSDKAHAGFRGESLAVRAARLAGSLCSELWLVGGDPPAAAPGRRVGDEGGADAPRCALRGLVSALAAAQQPRVLVVATDLPLLSAPLLAALIAWPEADAVVPRPEGRPQPLCAVYRREAVLPVARARLEAGPEQWKLVGLLEAVDTAWVDEASLRELDPSGQAFANANTPAELAALA